MGKEQLTMGDKSLVFTRHARRRMQLYNIPQHVISNLLEEEIILGQLGKQVIVKSVKGTQYPIKIVFEVRGKDIIIITVYPLKRGAQ